MPSPAPLRLPEPASLLHIPWGRYPLCDHLLPAGGSSMARLVRCTCKHYGDFCGGGGSLGSSTADQLLERARLGSQLLRVISDVEYSDPHLPKPAPPDRESAISFLLRTVAVVVFGSLAALVGLIFFTMAMTRLCVEGPCCDDEDSQTAAGEDRQPPATLTTTSSPPSAPSPPARSRELNPAAAVAPVAAGGHSPRRDSPPPYPGRRQARAQEEEPPPSYREVCEVIHC